MKSDFLLAITQMSAEKNLPREIVLAAVETALTSAYRKANVPPKENISVKINPTSGKVQVWSEKLVVEQVSDDDYETSLEEAQRIKPAAQLGETVLIETTPRTAGRIAAQTAKQIILQRLREAEHDAIFEEYTGREGDIVNGVVQRFEARQILIDLGRTEAILPVAEQVPGERYRVGQRLKVAIVEIVRTNKGPRVIVSRSHPDLLRRLFEMEVPEIFSGTVEIKSVAREAGVRSKVAVHALQQGVDAVGCCVGLRGIRIENIARELNGEKIDVVVWHPDTANFIANALSPAQISKVELKETEKTATVLAPDRQLSLAIGREGQNVRLAAKLTGWRIDVKSASAVEEERAEAAAEAAKTEVAEAPAGEIEVGEQVPVEPTVEQEAALTPEETEEEALPALETPIVAPPESLEPAIVGKPPIRFAEDILSRAPAKPQSQTRKKQQKGSRNKETEEEKTKGGKKGRRDREILIDDEEDY
ncbi:MAG: transcription termination factor NusA [Dehalococcoidales bacterium]|nr:transcription termination factor NusA [Dehalococcoidales bacterium]